MPPRFSFLLTSQAHILRGFTVVSSCQLATTQPRLDRKLATPLHGCWKKINCNRGDPLPHVSVESLGHIKSPRACRSKRIRIECPAAAAARNPQPLMNFGKVVKHHKTDTCTQQFSASTKYSDSQDSTRDKAMVGFKDEN